MPQGYYTIEQWTSGTKKLPGRWTAVLQSPFGASLTDAEKTLEQLNKPGFYRIVQMQRVIWAEKESGKVRLRKSHATSPNGLDQMRKMFDRCNGRYPIEEVKETRRRAKKKVSGTTDKRS